MPFRHFLSWKPLFYDALLPALGITGSGRCDAALAQLGRLAALWPPRRRELATALARARQDLGADWQLDESIAALAANTFRFLARDYPLDRLDVEDLLGRFDVTGYEHVAAALRAQQGMILLGNHLGAYLAALHWLFRHGVPLRLLVQRPGHVSRALRVEFDRSSGPHPQAGFLLRRRMPPAAAVERMIRARAALRAGLAVYLTCDVPWNGPNARSARLLGHTRQFLAVWADLAVLARSPVIPLFCTHRPGGRYALTFDPPIHLDPGEQDEAVVRALDRLNKEIKAHPAEAVAHLLWPCYAPRDAAEPLPCSDERIQPLVSTRS